MGHLVGGEKEAGVYRKACLKGSYGVTPILHSKL